MRLNDVDIFIESGLDGLVLLLAYHVRHFTAPWKVRNY